MKYNYNTLLAAAKSEKYYELIQMLENNIKEENAATAARGIYRGKDKLKVITRALKVNKENERFQKAHLQKNNKYMFTNGYEVFLSDDTLSYPAADPHETFKIDSIFESEFTDSAVIDPAEIKLFISLNNYKRNGRYSCNKPYIIKTENNKFIGVNPFYLIDLLEYSGQNKIVCNKHNTPIASPDISCFILPINIGAGYSENDYITFRKTMLCDDSIQEIKTA